MADWTRSPLLTPTLVVAAGIAVASLGTMAREDTREAQSLEQALAVITPQVPKGHVQFLSHDLLAGRDTGAPGYEIAREYVASQFRRMGLEPAFDGSYIQKVDLLSTEGDKGSELKVGTELLTSSEASFSPDWLGREPTIDADGVYVGYGLIAEGRSDYQPADVKGRIVFMLPGVPADWAEDPIKSLLTRTKTRLALASGARGIIVLNPEGNAGGGGRTLMLADGTAGTPRPLVTVSGAGTKKLLAAWGVDAGNATAVAAKGQPAKPTGRVSITRVRDIGKLASWNVGALVPGSDPVLRKETVVFTAHLDHVGVGEPDDKGDRIFNGTHDNAMGIGKLLASAEAMARLRPRRTVVFVAVGAEERGMLGSWYYVNHPVGTTADIVANINHDGGLEGAASDDVFAFGADYSELGKLIAEVAPTMNMRLTTELTPPFSPSQALLFRSDQHSFLLRGIPAIYLMDGFTVAGDHERGRKQWDDYLKNFNHKQRDNFDPSWTFEAPARMAALSVRLAWRLANDDSRPRIRPGGIFPTSPSE